MTKPKICNCSHKASEHSANWGCEMTTRQGACRCIQFVEAPPLHVAAYEAFNKHPGSWQTEARDWFREGYVARAMEERA